MKKQLAVLAILAGSLMGCTSTTTVQPVPDAHKTTVVEKNNTTVVAPPAAAPTTDVKVTVPASPAPASTP